MQKLQKEVNLESFKKWRLKKTLAYSYKLNIWNVSFWIASMTAWEDALPTEKKWLMPLYNTTVKAPLDATQSCGHSVSGYLTETRTVQGKTGWDEAGNTAFQCTASRAQGETYARGREIPQFNLSAG